jgi:dTDP-4-dehydrorhamnose reductase
MKLENSRVLLTGGSGRLGRELIPLLEEEGADVSAPTSTQWDITQSGTPVFLSPWVPDIIVHCAAYTDVPGAEREKEEAIRTNIFGTEHVVVASKTFNSRLVHISSDYVPCSPMGFYAVTKWMAEALIPREEMIIRTSFKPRGMWGENALKGVFHPVHTNGDWVDIIAKNIVIAIKSDLTGIVNVGTEDKTLKDLALQEYPDVSEIPVEEADNLLGYYYPRDTRMNITI